MPKHTKQYDNESISSLKGAQRVRLRPGVIFGSDGLEGCSHSVFEILSNSIDEAREGHGNKIVLTQYKDGFIEVEDFGRGIPVDYNTREERYNWELIFCELYAGGKYDTNADNYEFSLGLNGLGLCATQYASEVMDVTIWRDGFQYTLHFEQGENVGGLKKAPVTTKRTGTLIKWRPDLAVFTDIAIPAEWLRSIMQKQAIVNAGLQFELRVQKPDGSFATERFCYEGGIVQYLEEVAEGKNFTAIQRWQCERKGRDRADLSDYRVKMDIAFCFNNHNTLMEYYHNSSFLEHGGSPDKAVKNAFLWAFDSYLKQQNKYTKAESKITFNDIADSLMIVVNSFSTQTSYENQTKKSITNKFIQDAMTEFLRSQLEIFFLENKADADKIADQILVNKRSRESAEKTRISLKKKLTGNLDIQNRVQKFVDCRSKDLDRRELYIVEGDSALTSCKMGRDAEFQAVIPLRGKILNCLKADYDKIFKNDIITDLIKVLGCGVEVGGSKKKDLSSFSLDNLRWNKVILCTDADVDGFQIRTLILTMIWRLMPDIIDAGKVYIAESPLYEITCKNETYFAYSDKEKNEILKTLTGKVRLQRSKGLGENEPEMMWQTTMNPATRRLIQVLPSEQAATEEMFDILLGDNLQGRKDFIAQNGSRYLELADLS